MDADTIQEHYTKLLKFSNNVTIFETAYYFQRPIESSSTQAFLLYPLLTNGLHLKETYREFKANLDALIKIISILEARLRKTDQEQKEAKEKKFTSIVGTITGIIAVLTFFADAPAILKNTLSIEATPLLTWSMFGTLSLSAFLLYRSFLSKRSP